MQLMGHQASRDEHSDGKAMDNRWHWKHQVSRGGLVGTDGNKAFWIIVASYIILRMGLHRGRLLQKQLIGTAGEQK